MAIGGKGEGGQLYVIDLAWGHWTPTEIINKLLELTSYWRLKSLVVESVGGFANLKYSIKEGFEKAGRMIHIIEYRPKGDKKERLELMLQPLLNNEQLYLAQRFSSTKEVKEEFSFFPSQNVRDDIIDSIAVLHELSRHMPKASAAKRSHNRKSRTVNSKYGGIR
jgi:predicted phage terminase large subunit-like protein